MYSACELVTSISKRNGSKWRDDAIVKISNEVCKAVQGFIIIIIYLFQGKSNDGRARGGGV